MNRNEILIEASELKDLIDDDKLRLFDAPVLLESRGEETARDVYLKGHLPNAAFFDHIAMSDENTDLMFMVPDDLAMRIGKLGIANDSVVVFYSSAHIMWATRAFWLLRYAGHDNVRILNGGVDAWLEAGGSLTDGEAHYEPAEFTGRTRAELFASKEDVLAAMNDGATCTVNTLPHDLYTGDTDIFYGKEGHITGSVNHPYDNLLEGQKFLSNDEIAARLADKSPGDKVITYCGGGIAATLNAVASLLAGIDDVAVYDGSMSEWIKEGLPTTRGENPA